MAAGERENDSHLMPPGVTLLEEDEMAVTAAVAHLPQLTRDGYLLDEWPIV